MRETMAKEEESKKSSQNSKSEDGERSSTLFSPGFRSVAAMAGWDEEALLMASLVVEDTPDRNLKHKKRTALLSSDTPSTNSRRKRRAQRRSTARLPVTILDLDEVECEKKETEIESSGTSDRKKGNVESKQKDSEEPSSSAVSEPPAIPCIDKLREELSCAICLEICFEPSTTPCGHSFCKKCLRSAADKCGKKCPKCRQLISNGRSCTVNTVLWNTIQLLFPKEVETRKAIGGSREAQQQTPARTHHHHNTRNRTLRVLGSPDTEHLSLESIISQSVRIQSGRPSGMSSSRGDFISSRLRRELPSQDEDAAMALRLQREEFMGVFRDSEEQGRSSRAVATTNSEEQQRRRSSSAVATTNSEEQQRRRSSLAVARANLRAMASTAISIRTRNRGT